MGKSKGPSSKRRKPVPPDKQVASRQEEWEMQSQAFHALLVHQWPALEGLLDVDDLKVLWDAKFRNVASIEAATEATLLGLPLAPGIVSVLKSAKGLGDDFSNRSEEDADAMLDNPDSLATTPKELFAALKKGKIRIPGGFYYPWLQQHPRWKSRLEESQGFSPLANTIAHALTAARHKAGASEEAWGQTASSLTTGIISAVDQYVEHPLRPHLDRNRQTDRTLTDFGMPVVSCRPDNICVIGRLLSFQGEEKRRNGQLDQAEADMVRKNDGGYPPRAYHDMKFMPAYISAGSEFQWACIEIADGKVHLDDTIYDMNDLSDSIHIVRGSMRLHIVLTQLMSLAPPLSDRFNYAHSELRGFEDLTEISFGRIKKQIVFKKVVRDADRFFEHYYTSVDNVKAAYQATKGVTGFVQAAEGPHYRKLQTASKFVVCTMPIAFEKIISEISEKELLSVVRTLLKGLSELHGKKLVHTDIRWSNVLFTSTHALLIDLEAANMEGFEVPDGGWWFSGWAEDMFEINEAGKRVYTQRSDLWQVGKLMESWESESGTPLSLAGKALKESLLGKTKMTVDYL